MLLVAEIAGYDVLLTVEQGTPRQQPHAQRKLSVILIRTRTNQMEDLTALTTAIARARESIQLESIQPGESVVIPYAD